jgi:hypothetical protein
LISIYFAFTSLSTVGFGDYYPVSSLERIVCAFVLLIGVAMFSYILGELIQGVTRINRLNKPFGKEEDLDRFFKILYYFNNSKPIDSSIEQNIRSFLKIVWEHNKNNFIASYEDQMLFDQLPSEVQT